MSAERSFAVIPAAGKSTRMGRPKLALPLGGCTVLQRVLAAVREGGVRETVVVLGPHVAELAPLAEAAGAYALLLPEETPDMRATVERGLRWLEERFCPAPEERWLLLPADHPTLDPDLVRRLLAARAAGRSLVIPTFQGKRGHPAVIAWRHVAGIRALPPGEGLNRYFRQHEGETLEVPVESADVLCDLDTPEDYERLRQRWEGLPLGSVRASG
jgi:molybdenum cofactor cytidylyltransferase